MTTYTMIQSTFEVDATKGKDKLSKVIGLFRMEQTERPTWKQEQVTIEEMKELVLKKLFVPAFLNVKAKNHKRENFLHSKVLVLDFDNGESPEYVINSMKDIGVEPAIVYTSVSDSPEKRKFRAIILVDKVIMGAKKYEDTLAGIFYELWESYGIEADMKSMDATHFFFPGKEIIYTSESIVDKEFVQGKMMDIQEVRKVYNEYKKETTELTAKAQGKTIQEMKVETATKINPLAEAILKQDIETCRKLVGYPMKVDGWNQMSREEKMKAVKMSDLFNVNVNEKFNCWLPGHIDEDASANIYITDDGMEIYKCFGCEVKEQLHSLIGRMIGKNTRETARFLTKITGLEWLSEYQLNAMVETKNLEQVVISDSFKEMYPILHKEMNRKGARITLQHFYLFLINQVSMTIVDKPLTDSMDKITFFMSSRTIAKRMQDYGLSDASLDTRRKKAEDYMKRLALLGLVTLETSEVDDKFMGVAKAYKDGTKRRYHTNFYTLNTSYDVFKDAEKFAQEDIKKGLRKGKISKRELVGARGEESAKDLYPQDDLSYLNYSSVKRVLNRVTKNIVEKQGYASIDDIITAYQEFMKRKGEMSRKKAAKIVDDNRIHIDEFQLVRVNKAVREAAGIPATIKSNSRVFIQK